MSFDDRSDDRRGELLERAYRRGYALRRRRRWSATFAGLVVIAVAAGGAVAVSDRGSPHQISVVQGPTTTTAPGAHCVAPIAAEPASAVPHDVSVWAVGAPVIGDGVLWTTAANVTVPGTLMKTHWELKFPWYTRVGGFPSVTARRLDGSGTFRYDMNRAFGPTGAFDTSLLEFSAPGCWEVTARLKGSTLQFRVEIGPVPTTVAFADAGDGVGLDPRCTVPADADPVCDIDLLSSSDAGRTWTRKGGVRNIDYAWRGYPDIELAVSGANIWIYGTRTFVSHDGGSTFTEEHLGLVSALAPAGDDVWFATRACAQCPTETLMSAPAGGGTSTRVTGFPDLGDPYVELVRPTANVAYVVGLDTHADLYRTADAGRTWQAIALPPAPPGGAVTVSMAALGSEQLWVLVGGRAPGRNQEKSLYVSNDGGARWTLLASTSPSPGYGPGELPLRGLSAELTVTDARRLWIAIGQGPLIGSVDGGRQWADSGLPAYTSQLSFVDPTHGWAWNDTRERGYVTTDGEHWSAILS